MLALGYGIIGLSPRNNACSNNVMDANLRLLKTLH